jgi:hypothetical protein
MFQMRMVESKAEDTMKGPWHCIVNYVSTAQLIGFANLHVLDPPGVTFELFDSFLHIAHVPDFQKRIVTSF